MEPQSCQLNPPVVAPDPITDRFQQLASRVRCLIDGRKLGHGGVGVYTENLIFGLAALPQLELTVLVRAGSSIPSLDALGIAQIQAPRSPQFFKELFLSQLIRQGDYDLYHAPHYTLLPLGLKIPSVVTIHDAIHVYHPQRFFYPLIARPLIKLALRRAGRVITVSQASASDLNRLLPTESGKTAVIPNAIDPFFMQQPCDSESTLKRIGLGRPYLLCNLSQFKPPKGLQDLLIAFKALETDLNCRGLILALVGQGTAAPGVINLVKSLGLESRVKILGAVSKETLRTIYSDALALVVPSLYEGSSLPTLEAKGLGLRIVARPCPPIVELLDPIDIVCADYSIQALIDGMQEIVGAGRIATKGSLSKLSQFSRESVAGQTWAVYQQLLGER